MNVRFHIAAALVLATAANANAAEPTPLHWDCSRTGTPTLHETAATYGYDNYTRVPAARDALYRQVRQACARGTDRIVVVAPAPRADLADRRVARR